MSNLRTYLLISLLHVTLVVCAVTLWLLCKNQLSVFNEFDFLHWDAAHYYSIVFNGYNLSNAAFFPFFPLLWDLTNFSPVAISILNFLIFIGSVAYLASFLRITYWGFLLFLSVPANLYMALPYAESYAFLFGSLYLVSLYKEKFKSAAIFLLILGTIKPTAAVFLFVILIAESIIYLKVRKSQIQLALMSVAALIISLLGVLVFYHSRLGSWTAFFDSQSNWGNKLGWPNLPLSTWNQSFAIWLDSSAFFISLALFFALIRICQSSKVPNRAVLYSILYLLGTTAYVVLFRDGMLFSLNRFFMASPFFVFIIYSVNSKNIQPVKIKYWLISFLVLLLSSLIFGSYLHIRSLISYAVLLSFLIVLFWLLHEATKLPNVKRSIKIKIIGLIAYVILIIIQAYYIVGFLNGEWLA